MLLYLVVLIVGIALGLWMDRWECQTEKLRRQGMTRAIATAFQDLFRIRNHHSISVLPKIRLEIDKVLETLAGVM